MAVSNGWTPLWSVRNAAALHSVQASRVHCLCLRSVLFRLASKLTIGAEWPTHGGYGPLLRFLSSAAPSLWMGGAGALRSVTMTTVGRSMNEGCREQVLAYWRELLVCLRLPIRPDVRRVVRVNPCLSASAACVSAPLPSVRRMPLRPALHLQRLHPQPRLQTWPPPLQPRASPSPPTC